MLKLDYSINHVPAVREHIVFLYESINQPLMNLPETGSHPTGAYILGTWHPNNVFYVFVYLHQPKTGAVLLYVSDPRGLSREQCAGEEQEAVRFVESMGFMVDNVGFMRLPPGEQELIIARVPLFHPPHATTDFGEVASPAPVGPLADVGGAPRPVAIPGSPDGLEGFVLADPSVGAEPGPGAGAGSGSAARGSTASARAALERVGRFLASFSFLVLCAAMAIGCRSMGGGTEHSNTENHLTLGNQQLAQGHWAEAIRAFTTVLEEDEKDREALWGMGVAYWRLERREKAEEYLRRAIQADPKWTVPKNELAGVLLDLGRCKEAEALLRQVVDDIFYPFPEFAEHNLASAEACEGRTQEAIARLEALVVKRPHFCLGYLTLAQLSSQAKQAELTIRACDGFEANCESHEEIRRQILPEQSAMCYFRRGLAHAELGDVESARTSFMRCRSDGTFGKECLRSLEMLPP